MPDTLRAFIAVELPGPVVAAIGDVQAQLKAHGFKVRWVRPENMHLTLKFLGDIRGEAVGAVGRAMARSAESMRSFSINVKGLGVFPGPKRPRVIWCGAGGQTDRLRAMQGAVAGRLEAVGFARDKRPFRGHLTLGRVKGRIDAEKLARAMDLCRDFESETFRVRRIVLFKSALLPTGPVYTNLKTARVGTVDARTE